MQAGDPQGAILSLIIYNIFTHDVPDIPSLLLENKSMLILLPQQYSAKMTNKQWNLEINPKKIETTAFGLRRIKTFGQAH